MGVLQTMSCSHHPLWGKQGTTTLFFLILYYKGLPTQNKFMSVLTVFDLNLGKVRFYIASFCHFMHLFENTMLVVWRI